MSTIAELEEQIGQLRHERAQAGKRALAAEEESRRAQEYCNHLEAENQLFRELSFRIQCYFQKERTIVERHRLENDIKALLAEVSKCCA